MLAPSPASAFLCDRALQRRIEERVARHRRLTAQKAQDWQIAFGPEKGLKGETKTVVVTPRCYFRGDKIMATDDAVPPGSGTLLIGLFVGRKNQFPVNQKIPTSQFSANSLGRGRKLDTCQPAISLTMQVEFLKDCTFNAVIFGKALH